jgi:hypothetical protein
LLLLPCIIMPPMVQKDDVDESSLIISIRLMDVIGFLLQAEAAVSDKKTIEAEGKGPKTNQCCERVI